MIYTAKEAIEIGHQIAIKHKANVLEILEMGSTPEMALEGCIVSLAADIMIALNRANAVHPLGE